MIKTAYMGCDMLKEYYTRYLAINRQLSPRSVKHYLTGINTINSILKQISYPITDIYSISTIEDIENIKDLIFQNEIFIHKDSIGRRMYSAALNHFYRFACEADRLVIDGIQLLDMALPKPEMEYIGLSRRWPRNHVVKSQVIQFAHYNCEYDRAHTTFTSSWNLCRKESGFIEDLPG